MQSQSSRWETEILLDEVRDPEMNRIVDDIGQAGRKIHNLIKFTSEYQELGRHQPIWADIALTSLLSVGQGSYW